MTSNLLKTLLTLAAVAAFTAPGVAIAADAAAGKGPFEANCSSCHGLSGKGDGPVGAALNPKPRDFSVGEFKLDTDGDGEPGTDVDLANVILKGASAFGGSPLMAPWGGVLAEGDLENVIAYIRSLEQ